MVSHDKAGGDVLTFGQALQSRQSLASVPLLDTDVDIILLGPNLVISVERVTLVCEGVCTCQKPSKRRQARDR